MAKLIIDIHVHFGAPGNPDMVYDLDGTACLKEKTHLYASNLGVWNIVNDVFSQIIRGGV